MVSLSKRTFKCRQELPHLDWATRGELSHAKLHVVSRSAYEEQHEEVRKKERAAAVLQCHKRKSPYVTEANSQGDAGQQKLRLVPPFLSCCFTALFFLACGLQSFVCGWVW